MNQNTPTGWEKEFDKRFADMTHVGCADDTELEGLPCGDIKLEVKAFIRRVEAQAERRTANEILADIGRMKPEDFGQFTALLQRADIIALISKYLHEDKPNEEAA
jgi:hypothetical protein